MVVLDTDHMSLLEWADVRDSMPLRTRLAALPPAEVATTIISYEEQMRGWMAYIARTRSMTHQVEAYRRLRRQLENYCRTPVLAFDEQAAATLQRLRRARIRMGTGGLDAAIRVFEEGLALCRASDDQAVWGRIAGGLGEAYAHTGRLAEGLALLEEARQNDLYTGAVGGGYASHLRQLSAVYLLAGRVDEARQHARQALDLAQQLKACGEEALALFQLGAVHAHASPPDVQQAEARYREALTLAEALGMRPLQAHCHHGLGTLYSTVGRPEPARIKLSTAIALYRAMEMTFWLPQAEAALAQVGSSLALPIHPKRGWSSG